jgi:hypothetical protein
VFDGFESANIDVGETTIFARHKGSGPALLLLHGFPQNHVMCRRAAPALAQRFAVVCADLRGYGASGTPESTADHAPYAKRAMARDMVKLTASLGHERFAVAGHARDLHPHSASYEPRHINALLTRVHSEIDTSLTRYDDDVQECSPHGRSPKVPRARGFGRWRGCRRHATRLSVPR